MNERNETLISIKNLTKRYGNFTAVDHLSFDVKCGTMIGFLGVNGAGKSTTINMLSTLLKPDEGEVNIGGAFLGKDDRKIREMIGVVYQQNVLDELLSVKENILIRAAMTGVDNDTAAARLKEMSELLKLGDILNKKYKLLSGGQKRRCEIAVALIHAPKILFLDEPTTGLDPATRIDVWNAVKSLRENRNMTVFLTTHYMEEAATADKIIIIDKGVKLAEGSPFELKEIYAKDRLRLHFSETYTDKIEEALTIKIPVKDFQKTSGEIEVFIENSLSAIPLLETLKPYLKGFEVIQGNMDDVFLNVTKENE